MSLLLDALKKAAEQKARQAKAASDDNGDDKTVEVSADDTIVTDDSTIEYRERAEFSDDDTEISDDPTHEVTAVIGRDDDVTDVYDQDETLRYGEGSTINEDDTHLLEEETVVEPGVTARPQRSTEDVTEHTEVIGSGDDTDFDPITDYGSAEDDDTILDSQDQTQQVDQEETLVEPDVAGGETAGKDVTERTAITEVVDDTEFDPVTEYGSPAEDDTLIDSEDQTQQTDVIGRSGSAPGDGDVTIRSGFDEDETASIDADQDVADFMGDLVDDTTHSPDEPTQAIDEDADQTRDPHDDMSLLLADGYDHDIAGDDDSTAQRGSQLDGDTEMETLGMVDEWQEAVTQTSTITADHSDGSTSGVKLESLRHENTIIRPDATSTHTYAPDNYDRTLIRPPSDDASRIFAGMKAEDDVLMTPDYAKRVFLSKSSANRMQHYKVYVGIGVSVFLAIGIFSMFELVDEHSRIDSTMLPLMRDPMPGIIRNENNRGEVNVLDAAGQPDVNLETLELAESASVGAVTEEVVNDEPEVREESGSLSGTVESQNQPDATDQDIAEAQSSEEPVEPVSEAIPQQEAQSTSAGSLQISSSSKVSELDQWLADGYAAYQRGDNETALANYARVLQVEPSNRNALLASAAIKVQNGNTAAAIADYQQLLLANPKDTLAMSSLISIARTAPQESESQLKLMIRDEPDSPHLNFVLANVYGAQNRWQEAQGLYFVALQNKPKDPNYAYNLAVSLEHISKPKAAIVYYERAIANIANGLATFDKDLVDSRIEMLKQL